MPFISNSQKTTALMHKRGISKIPGPAPKVDKGLSFPASQDQIELNNDNVARGKSNQRHL